MEGDLFLRQSAKPELSFAQTVMDSADRRQMQPKIIFNDSDVQSFRRCLANYMGGEYAGAMQEIRQLRSRYSDVVHIHLNELIIGFYLGRCTNVDGFLTDMKEAMTRTYGPNFENSRIRDLTQVGYLYNYAVILFYVGRYAQSLQIAQTVARYFETLEDGLVRDCCFLLLELYIVNNQMAEALAVISYLEEEFHEDTGLRIVIPENLHLESLLFDEHSQMFRPMKAFRTKVKLYKLKIANTFHLEPMSKKESRGILSNTGISLTNATPTFLKSQAEYSRGDNAKATKYVTYLPIGNSQTAVVNGDVITSLYYNALGCINSSMGKNTTASVFFNRALDENTKAMQTIAVPQSPSINALPEYNTIPLQCINASRVSELLLNLGIQLLVSGQPSQAFPLLVEAVQTYHQNPRVWLRLAECCITKHKQDVIDPLHRRKPTRYLVKGHVGSGKFRKLLLSSVLLPYQKQLAQKAQPGAELRKDPSEPGLTHDFARMCLINGLAMANRILSRNASGREGEDLIPLPPGAPISKQELLNIKAYILVNLAFVSNCLFDFVGGIDYAKQAEAVPGVPGVVTFLVSSFASEGLIRMSRIPEAGHYLSVPYINNVFRVMKEDLEKEGQVNVTTVSGNAPHSGDSNGPEAEQPHQYEQPSAAIKSVLHIPNDYLRKRPIYSRNVLVYNHAVWLCLNGDLEASFGVAEKLKNAATNSDTITRARAAQLCIYIRFRQGKRHDALKLILEECPEWKDRLAKDFDEDERKLRLVREQQGIPWPLDS